MRELTTEEKLRIIEKNLEGHISRLYKALELGSIAKSLVLMDIICSMRSVRKELKHILISERKIEKEYDLITEFDIKLHNCP